MTLDATLREQIKAASRACHLITEEMQRRIRAVGLKTGVVTNNLVEFGTYWRAIIPLDDFLRTVAERQPPRVPGFLARVWDSDFLWSFRHSPVAIVSSLVRLVSGR